MSSDLTRRSLIGAAFAALVACGFTPAYGPDGPATALRDRVSVTAPATVTGFALAQRIEDRIGQGDALRLLVDISDTREPAAVTVDGDTTRFQIVGIATWQLLEGIEVRAEGRAETFTSYSATGSTVATQSAEADALDRLATALADRIVSDLILAQVP